MKTFIISICLIGFAIIPAEGQTKTTAMETTPTFTCKLTTPELQKRKATVIAELKAVVQSRTELEDGYEYSFNATEEILEKLATFVKTEHHCCDFFTFQLIVEGDKVVLSITGPGDSKSFLKEEIDL